jgi:preprotein translocase subunit SecY
MKLLKELFRFLDIDQHNEQLNRAFTMFIKVLVVMIMLVAALAFSLLVYNIIVNDISENTTFGIIDYI